MLHNISNQQNIVICNKTYNLPDNANEPIVHLHKCTNVLIHDLDLDGNKENQTSEISDSMGFFVRNNCISLRECNNICIFNCNLRNARSGGIVPSLCENIYIINCKCGGNFFDGIAPYCSSNILIYNCTISNNLYSGVSIDGNSKNVRVYNSTITYNNDWGVWFGPEQNIDDEQITDIAICNKLSKNYSGNIFPVPVVFHKHARCSFRK